LLKKLNPDFFKTVCVVNLDITVHMCLPTQSKKFSILLKRVKFVQNLAF